MGRPTNRERRVRTVQKNNTGTYTVSIPIAMMRSLGWARGQRVVMSRRGEKITIEPQN